MLEIRDLKTHFFTYHGVIKAVDGVSLTINREEVLGIVGETGCGKSITARSILKLIQDPGRIMDGTIHLDGEDILSKSEKEMQHIRGGKVSMIFQNPLSSLNPIFTIGEQVCHIIRIHQGNDKKAARERALEMFSQVRLPNPNRLLKKYPHELSGGQLQRVMIAMALSCEPDLLIADEPTTALDVTIQAQILTLMLRLKEETRTSILLISHDLGVIAELCDKVAIMYAGKIVELASATDIFNRPLHPYTEGLMSSIPGEGKPGDKLETIKGIVPNLIAPPPGCRFHPRCPIAEPVCSRKSPTLTEDQTGHSVACHLR
ncbi:MAG: ABC transporter ATP-binding protein [Deltaproteobacteria bacterium]|nr:ABC transporter ATP-binding protein [Deltaproteobacteria bacterium]MBT7716589.1 ABC transporter ATP-binding protein [Deltaproteobacteria bacterium]